MKNFLVILVLIFVLGSCSNNGGEGEIRGAYAANQSQTAYSLTHGGYVGRAVITIDSKGKVSVDIDDAFLPHVLAVVDYEDDQWSDDNTVKFISHGDELYVAKYVEYNGVIYVAVSIGEGFIYVEADENGMPLNSLDLEFKIIRNQKTMAQYFDIVPKGKFKILDAFDGKATPITTTPNGGLTKKTSPGYWNFGQTWVGNIEAIEEFIEKNGVQFNLSDMKRAEEPNKDGLKFWSVTDAITGATNADFKDYFGLVQSAAGRLKTNQ